jgi:hypothetical protein
LSNEQTAEQIRQRLREIQQQKEALRIRRRLNEIQARKSKLMAQESATGEVGFGEAVSRSFFEGLSQGFSEELLTAAHQGEFDSQEELDQFKREQIAQRKEGEKEFGVSTTVAELAGNVIGGAAIAAGAIAALPATLPAAGLAAFGVVTGGSIGALNAAGKSEADVDSKRFKDDVMLGGILGAGGGLIAQPASRLVAAIGQKTGATNYMRAVGANFRKFANQPLRDAAAGKYGPSAKKIADKLGFDLTEIDTNKASQMGIGEMNRKSVDKLEEEIEDQVIQNLDQRPFRLKRKARGPRKETQRELTRKEQLLKELDQEELLGPKMEQNKKILRLALTKGNAEERAEAKMLLEIIDDLEDEWLIAITNDIKAARAGEFGINAKKLVDKEYKSVAKQFQAEHEKILAEKTRKAAEASDALKDDPTFRKLFNKFLDTAPSARLLKETIEFGAEKFIPQQTTLGSMATGGVPAVAGSLVERD